MITANVISRVFYLSNPAVGGTGTCFTIDHKNRQYFVTAKHVIATLVAGDNIELFFENKWNLFPLTMVAHSALADVSIFAIELVIHGHPLPASAADMAYGQDMYFLGFPYGFRTDIGPANREFPLPIVKKAIASSTFTKDRPMRFLLDGHNNPGFSGGPVVFVPLGGKDFQIAGIISGFYKELNAQGQVVEYTNSGIIIAYAIPEAVDLIEANENGTVIQ